MAQDREQGLDVLNTTMKLLVPQNAENIFIGCGVPDFSRTEVFVVTKKLLKGFQEFP